MTSSFNMSYHAKFSLKPQNPCTIIPPKKPPTSSISHSFPQPKLHKTNIKALSSSSSIQKHQENAISSTTQKTQELKSSNGNYNVEFKTMKGCKLGIARYPDFEYDAEGGFGSGSGKDDSNGKILVEFDVAKLYIPSLTSETTKFLGLPLPPFFTIDIVPEFFKGSIDKVSGKVDLEFRAEFWFSMGTIYKAPPLLVSTNLTSAESQGRLRKGKGQRMEENGKCTLVGVARVDPIDDVFMNTFLGLPTECLAILNATLSFMNTAD